VLPRDAGGDTTKRFRRVSASVGMRGSSRSECEETFMMQSDREISGGRTGSARGTAARGLRALAGKFTYCVPSVAATAPLACRAPPNLTHDCSCIKIFREMALTAARQGRELGVLSLSPVTRSAHDRLGPRRSQACFYRRAAERLQSYLYMVGLCA
jgi:hypothetical protein